MPTIAQVLRASEVISSGGTGGPFTLPGTLGSVANSVIQFNYTGHGSSERESRHRTSIVITNTTTLTWAQQSATGGEDVTVEYEVIEYDSGELETLDTGSHSHHTSTTTNDTSLSLTTAANTMIALSCTTDIDTENNDVESFIVEATSATNLQFRSATAGTDGNVQVEWQAVEFKASDLESTDAGEATFSVDNNTDTDTVTSADRGVSFLCNRGSIMNDTAQSYQRAMTGIEWTADTTATAERGNEGSPDFTIDWAWSMFEFADSPSVERGSLAFGTSDLAKTSATFSPTLDEDRSSVVQPGRFLISAGNTGPVNCNGPNSGDARSVLNITTDVDSITMTRHATGSDAIDGYFQVIEWPAAAAGGRIMSSLVAGGGLAGPGGIAGQHGGLAG